MARRHLQIAFFALLATTALHPQTQKPSGLPDESAPAIADVYRSNTLTLGLGISNEFDDNAFNDNRKKQANLMLVIDPHLTWKVSRPRLEWTLSYSNGFSSSQQVSAYNSQSHLLDFGLWYRPTKRLRFAFSNTFLNSTNPFDFFHGTGSGTGGGPSNQPNDFLLTASAHRTSEQARAESTYALSPHGTVGVSGSFLSLRYGQGTSTQLPLQFLGDESSAGGGIFYSHHLSRRQWARVDYGVQRMTFIDRSSFVQRVFYTHTISLSPGGELSIFAGPERAATDRSGIVRFPLSGISELPARWHWAAGATYNWSAAGTRLALGLYRQISNESGLLGAVSLSSVTAELHRPITPRWTADLAGAYDRNATLDLPRSTLSFVWAAAGLTRPLNRDMTITFKYWRVHQSADSPGLGSLAADHNRFSVSLGYDFRARLGR